MYFHVPQYGYAPQAQFPPNQQGNYYIQPQPNYYGGGQQPMYV